MSRHEWREATDEGVRIYRANLHGGRLELSSRLKDEEEWTAHDPPSGDDLRLLRDILWRKYQRKRVPYKAVQLVDQLLENDE